MSGIKCLTLATLPCMAIHAVAWFVLGQYTGKSPCHSPCPSPTRTAAQSHARPPRPPRWPAARIRGLLRGRGQSRRSPPAEWQTPSAGHESSWVASWDVRRMPWLFWFWLAPASVMASLSSLKSKVCWSWCLLELPVEITRTLPLWHSTSTVLQLKTIAGSVAMLWSSLRASFPPCRTASPVVLKNRVGLLL